MNRRLSILAQITRACLNVIITIAGMMDPKEPMDFPDSKESSEPKEPKEPKAPKEPKPLPESKEILLLVAYPRTPGMADRMSVNGKTLERAMTTSCVDQSALQRLYPDDTKTLRRAGSLNCKKNAVPICNTLRHHCGKQEPWRKPCRQYVAWCNGS